MATASATSGPPAGSRRCQRPASRSRTARTYAHGARLSSGGTELEHPAGALGDPHVDELAPAQPQRVAAGAGERVDDLARPRELQRGRAEGGVDGRQLARVDRRLAGEAERPGEARLMAEPGVVVEVRIDAVDRRCQPGG